MKLFRRQEEIINDDLKKCGIFLGTGMGKTAVGLLLARGKTLVVAPKIQRDDRNWQREKVRLNLLSLNLIVISKEEFRRDHSVLPFFDTVIFDESHTITGATPNTRQRQRVEIPRASQLFEAAEAYLNRVSPTRFYLCTATPARNPMSVWAAAILLGRKWDFYAFRRTFYIKLPMVGREVYQPKKDKASKERLAKCVLSLGYTGRLDDYFDVPEQTTVYRHCPLAKGQIEAIKALPLEFPDPLVLVGKTHQLEQGESKLEAIDDLLYQYPKVLIFAKYTAQIERITKHLEDQGVKVFVLTGQTKDRSTLMQDAEASSRCVFIAQSQISTGYELPSFRCTVFASCSYSTVDNTQAMGRTLRANALNKNLYVYLQSGKIDQAVLDCLRDHRDFSELLYAQKGSPISDTLQHMASQSA